MNIVTHVLGVRAFGTQLLCEQVGYMCPTPRKGKSSRLLIGVTPGLLQLPVSIFRSGRPSPPPQPALSFAVPSTAAGLSAHCSIAPMQTHLATWLALHDDGAGETALAAVEREFRRYFDCGPSTCSGQASSPTALPAPAAPTAGTTFSLRTSASVAASDGTTSHSTKRANDARQAAGYVRPALAGAWMN
jgi:hypothetical protein